MEKEPSGEKKGISRITCIPDFRAKFMIRNKDCYKNRTILIYT